MTPYPAYKPTGLPWLPQIPEHWDCIPLGRLARLKSLCGYVDRQLLSVYLDKGVVRFTDIKEKRTNTTSQDLSKYQLVELGDFVLNNQQAWRGSVGVSMLNGIVSPAYFVATLSKKLQPHYANYLFRSPAMVAHYCTSSKGIGSIQRNLDWQMLKPHLVPVPPPDEQAQIVRYLDSLTAKINKLIRAKKKQIALLEEQKQAIINQAVTKGLDPNAEMKDSGIRHIGFIPRHWKIIKNKHLFFENTALSTDGSEELLSVSLHYGVKKYSEITEEENTATLLPAESLAGYKIVRENDLVMNIMRARNGSFGFSKYHGIVSAAYCVYTLKQHCNPFFLHYLLKTPMVIKNFEENSYGIAEHRKRLYPDSFLSLFSILPPLEEQNLIVNWIEEKVKIFDVGIQKYQMEIALVSEYKNSMIASVVSGQVDIRNIPVDDFNPADLVSEAADDAEEEEPTAEESEE